MILRAKLIEARLAAVIASLTLAQAQEWASTTDKTMWVETHLLDPHDIPRSFHNADAVADALEVLLEAQQ